ncbi:MAG TPA: hypothetical protein VGQ55_08320, partial [Pyrinomonadaceae bacterium]|nr:hypothetical protein [Pyrinomonadaceae bacterium]
CGLKLDSIVEAVSDQLPSREYAEQLRRKEKFERIGLVSLSIAALVGFALLVTLAAQFKLIYLGPEVLYGSAIGALILFLLLSVFFFNYPKLFMTFTKRPAEEEQPPDPVTAKLIEDRPFEPASSVTESTTELLKVPRARSKR